MWTGPPRGEGRRDHCPGAQKHRGTRGSELSGLECKIHLLKLRPADAMMFFFYFGPKFKHLRTLWPYFAHHYRRWAEIWTSAEAMTLFLLITWFWAEIQTSADAMNFFAQHLILGHHWPKSPYDIFAPGPKISLGAPACELRTNRPPVSEHSNNSIISKLALLQVSYALYWPVKAKKN